MCRGASLGDDNHSFAQKPVVEHISGLQLGNYGSGRFGCIFDFLDYLMKIRVKNLPHNIHTRNAEFVKHLHQLCFGEFDAFEQGFAVFLVIVFGDGFNGAVEVVGNAEQIFAKRGNGVFVVFSIS